MARMGCKAWGTLAVASLWAAAAPANATVMKEVPLEDLARGSDAVVRGVVERAGVQLVLQDGELEPESVAHIRVLEWVGGPQDGRAPGERVVVRELGGKWKGGGSEVVGSPRYRQGEEVLVFLRRHPDEPTSYRTYAMAQGKFLVLRGVPGVPALARRDLAGVAFAHWTQGRMTLEHRPEGPAVQLGEILDLVRRVRGSTHGEGGHDEGLRSGGAQPGGAQPGDATHGGAR